LRLVNRRKRGVDPVQQKELSFQKLGSVSPTGCLSLEDHPLTCPAQKPSNTDKLSHALCGIDAFLAGKDSVIVRSGLERNISQRRPTHSMSNAASSLVLAAPMSLSRLE
jgi:hypothetical protein